MSLDPEVAMFSVDETRKKELDHHLRYWLPKPETVPSEVGYRVADLLDIAVGGLHHLDHEAAKQAKWNDTLYIEIEWRHDEFASYDNSLLTRLVFLAHDTCIRISIQPCTIGMLRVMFHPRKGRDGDFSRRHPTLEQAVAEWRLKK